MSKFFCKHEYKLTEGNIPVHYPDYEIGRASCRERVLLIV